MKKIYVLVVLITFLVFKNVSAQTTDSTLNMLLIINENQFINKPLDSIICILPTGYIKMKVRGIRTTARKITVLYPNKVWIELHVRDLTHMNPEDYNRDWSLPLMRQEKLFKTVIYKHNTCYRNCDVE